MSFSSVLFVKAKGSADTYSLSEYGFEIPISYLLLLSGNARPSQMSVDATSSALIEADFDTGYNKLFWFLQSCLDMQLIEKDNYERLSNDAHRALDPFYEQKAKIYLQLLTNVELTDLDDVDEDDDFGAMILSEIENTLNDMHSVFEQLRELKRAGQESELAQALNCPWSN